MGTLARIFGFGGQRPTARADAALAGIEAREMTLLALQREMLAAERTPSANPESVPAVLRAVSLVSGDIARARFTCDNPAVEMLLREPDALTSGYTFRLAMTAKAMTKAGNAYAYIARQAGEPVALQRLDPAKVRIKVAENRRSWWYEHDDMGRIERQDMLHIRGLILNGEEGVSPLAQCKDAARLIGRVTTIADRKMSGAGTGKLSIATDQPADNAVVTAIKTKYREEHVGDDADDNPLVTHSGFKATRIGLTLDELTWGDVASYSVEEVARMYGVPPEYLFSRPLPTDTEALGRLYVNGCLAHWAAAWSSEIQIKLGAVVEFDLDRIVRPSYAALMAGNRTAIECGILNVDEARDTLDLPPLPNGEGQQRFVAKNLGTGGGTTNIGVDTSLGAGQ